jgi:hypothetical protein
LPYPISEILTQSMFSNIYFIYSRLPINPDERIAKERSRHVCYMYTILTFGNVNTFEVVFPTSDRKDRDDVIEAISTEDRKGGAIKFVSPYKLSL